MSILIAAGGTGGHLFPGIAVADELRRRDPRRHVLFVGTPRGLETRIVPAAGYDLELLPVLPLKGVGARRRTQGLLALPAALARAAHVLARHRPAAVLGVGGYAGGPLVLMAALSGIHTVILEPNARPGFTNRLLRPFVRYAACAYEEARRAFGSKGVVTGNPVRSAFAASAPKAHLSPLALLTFGGSQGSRVINNTLVAALAALPGSDRLTIVHQTGGAMWQEVHDAYAAAGREAEVVPFIEDMAARFAAADLVVARSGATTCAELTAAGKAALLIPFAQAADDHQRVNAAALQAAGAARMLEERELTGESLGAAITALVEHPEWIEAMEGAARLLGRPDAAARVADLLEDGIR